MSTSQYYIVGNSDVWMIQFKDTENSQYKSSNEAISFAIATAQKLGMRGAPTYVCSMVMAACDVNGATIERSSPAPE